MSTIPRVFAAALLALAALSMSSPSFAQASAEFPSRRIEILVGVTPGSATDLLARLVAEKLAARWGQPVVVQNRPGAAQQLAADQVRRAAPDGHTLLVTHSGIMANPVMFKSFTLDLEKDFSHVVQLAATPWVFAVPHDLPVKSVAEFVSYAKANPDRVNFGSTGGTVDLDLGVFKRRAGIGGEVIPYPGGTQVLTALATGEIQAGLNSARGIASMPGKVRALAVTTEKRFSLAPDLPTVAESGLPGYKGSPIWYALWAPAGTPAAVVQKLNAEVNAILKLPDVEKRIVEGMAHEVVGGSAQDMERLVRDELSYYRRAARDAGLQPQ